nr:hypothetical protein [Tanacetum cinerariifolium]
GSTTGTQSRQQSASESAYAEEPVQTTSQMEETPLSVYETGADDQLPAKETTITGSCLEYSSASCSRRRSIMDKR